VPRSSRASIAAVWCLEAAIGLSALPGLAAQPRIYLELDQGWRFKQASGLTGAEKVTFDDSDWARVDIPHTWNRIGNEGTERSSLSNIVQGAGWYRLRFRTPVTPDTTRYFLQFDGVGAVADVWLNGHYLGRHEGAFSRFRFDASASISRSGDNVLVVKADNSRPQPGSLTEGVIPLSGDFFVFGGIYRSVGLIIAGSVHVDMLDFGGPGLYAQPLEIVADAATVQVTSRLTNDQTSARTVVVETSIEDADGKIVASASKRETLLAAKVTLTKTNLRIGHPRLWQGVSGPYLYQVILTLRSAQRRVLDRISQPMGLRTLRFDPDRGFFLNGEHLLLKGACMHQDRPVKGWAISRADQEQDFDLLTDMGANAVRLAHYQHDQPSYELADARGIVVWAEIPLVNQVSFDGSPGNPALTANASQQLKELIRQNYNHPSIAVWSIANEINLKATQANGPGKAAELLKSLDQLAKSEDPGRPTTLADCCEVGIPPHVGDAPANIAPRDAIVGIADTVGYNRYFGWYYGNVADLGPMLDDAHARHPELPLAVSEYGAGAALSQHSDDPVGGPINPHGRPHPEEFQNLYHEMSWRALRDRGYLWGIFIWNLFDFSSTSRREGDSSDINDKGLVSYDRQIRKDAFYFYRANWSAQPTLHLVGRRYVDRPYAVLNVEAYSNASRARLWLNGRDQGATACADGICLWHSVQLLPGTNDLRATAEVGGAMLSDALQWNFSGSPRIVRIKVGDISGYMSRENQRYGSDTYFTGGEAQGVNPPDASAENRIKVAGGDPRLYDTFREGEFSYRVPVPNGRYRISLKFAEPSASAVGERVFDVDVNGATVLKGFDIFAAAGDKLKSVDRSFDARTSEGAMLIAFRPLKGKALVSAIAITPLD
jgi:beta-galactosidase